MPSTPIPTCHRFPSLTLEHSMTNLQEYVNEVGELPRDILLGHMVIFTVRDGKYDLKNIAKLLDKHQLNPSFQPEENRPVDAFKKTLTKYDEHEYTDPFT